MDATDNLKLLGGWAAGLPYAFWRYLGRENEIQRDTTDWPWPLDDFPKDELAYDVSADGVQRPSCGHGPAFHRLYRVRVARPILDAERLVAVLGADPNVASPTEMARFDKKVGEPGRLAPGDEFLIRLPGLWNGPVRTLEVTPCSFRFATLDRHMEAGEIEFRASDEEDGSLLFEIESWARSADRIFDVLYNRLKLTAEIQLHMWAHFLERVAYISGGAPSGPVECITRRSKDYVAA